MDEEEVDCCPGCPVESPLDSSFKQAFQPSIQKAVIASFFKPLASV